MTAAEGEEQDFVEAVKWYRLAAAQGNAAAQFNLGLMYEEGQGVEQDYAEAVKWYRLAAEQGNAAAQFNLGLMYYNGRGVPEDYIEAFAWFNLAAAQGRSGGAKNRDILRKSMTPQQIDQAQARSRELGSGIPTKWQPSPPSTSPPPATNTLVRDTQAALVSEGYNPGPVDGLMGRSTRAAIRAFQRSLGLPATGQPSAELLLLLRAQ